MQKMNFYEEVGDLRKLLNPDKFKSYMLESPLGQIFNIKDEPYELFCENMCENAVSWILFTLLSADYSLDNIIVHEGSFNNYHHIWASIDDYYVDLTLPQFLYDCPDLSITKKDEVEKDGLYYSAIKVNAEEWAIEKFSGLMNQK